MSHHSKDDPINKWAQVQFQEVDGPKSKSKPNSQMGSSPSPTSKWTEVQTHQANESKPSSSL